MTAALTPGPTELIEADAPSGGAEPRLSPEHLAQLDAARAARRKIDRVAAVASFNAWTLMVFAMVSAPFALFSPTGLLVCLGLAVVAHFEFKGRDRVRALDPEGPRLLSKNQIGLAGVIVTYAGLQIYGVLTGESVYAEQVAATPELASTLEPLAEMIESIMLLTYGLVIVGSLLMQGLMAWYYQRAVTRMRVYLDETPRWILQLQRRES